MALAAVAVAVGAAGNGSQTSPESHQHARVGIDALTFLPTFEELEDESDVVVEALVSSITDYDIEDEPHLVSSRTVEQERLIRGGLRVREIVVTPLDWVKGSGGLSLRIVGGLEGDTHAGVAGIAELPNVVDITIGNVYRFYLVEDPIWFSSLHYDFVTAELLT